MNYAPAAAVKSTKNAVAQIKEPLRTLKAATGGGNRMKLDVCFRPTEVQGMDLRETLCIVLDIFRATTCMTTGMKNGCKAIIPVLSLEDARQAAQEQTEPVLLAGERQSLRLEGCELGNSPFDYAAEVVDGRIVVATTSNGTVAIKATDGAYRTLIGSFLNASAVCD